VKLTTPDGAWVVEAINLDGQAVFRIKHLGYLVAYTRELSEVARRIGPAYAQLEEVS